MLRRSHQFHVPRICGLIVLLTIAFFGGVANAVLITDGGFEAPPAAPGFGPSWTTFPALIPGTSAGDAGTVDETAPGPLFGIWGAPELMQYAVMTTAGAGGADDPSPPIPPAAPPGPYGSALPLFAGAIPVAALEAALGLPPLSLAPGVEGSGILHTPIDAGPLGSILTFSFQVATNEIFRPGGPAPDFPFLSVDGAVIPGPAAPGALTVVPLNGAFGWDLGPPGPPPRFAGIAGPFFLTPGMHTIALGVVDVGDTFYSTALYVDAIDLTAIPEPGAVLFGTFVCGVMASSLGLRRLAIALNART